MSANDMCLTESMCSMNPLFNPDENEPVPPTEMSQVYNNIQGMLSMLETLNVKGLPSKEARKSTVGGSLRNILGTKEVSSKSTDADGEIIVQTMIALLHTVNRGICAIDCNMTAQYDEMDRRLASLGQEVKSNRSSVASSRSLISTGSTRSVNPAAPTGIRKSVDRAPVPIESCMPIVTSRPGVEFDDDDDDVL